MSEKTTTIQDVAQRAGVSAMTVSRVINNDNRVAPTTRLRVEQAINDLGYVPNALARGLLLGRTRTIAVIISDMTSPFLASVARGVEDVAQRNGYTVILGNSYNSPDKEWQYVNIMLSNRIDGLILAIAGDESRKLLDFLIQRQHPFVLVDRYIDNVPADVVIGDSVIGARMLTEHLLKLGHQRIAMINGPRTVSSARDRQRGFEETLWDHGIEPVPALIKESNYRRSGGYQATQELLTLPPELRPTAIFAGNNAICIGTLKALREAQIQVPEDMALVCFDDLEWASEIYPFLTVVSQPARSFGTIAAQFLLERLTNADSWQPRKVVLTPELIVRLSCGASNYAKTPSVEDKPIRRPDGDSRA
jgi:LacI family transcriptional regulator